LNVRIYVVGNAMAHASGMRIAQTVILLRAGEAKIENFAMSRAPTGVASRPPLLAVNEDGRDPVHDVIRRSMHNRIASWGWHPGY